MINKKGAIEIDFGKIIVITLLICFVLIILFCFRMIFIENFYNAKSSCEYIYGANYTYSNNPDFGDTCIKADYNNLTILDRKILRMTRQEVLNKYCEDIGFWELNKWGRECQ